MTRTTYAIAAILAAAVCLLLGVWLGRSEERASAPMREWREDEDGVQPMDPWTAALADPAFVAGLRAGIADFEAGHVYRFTDVREGRCGAKLPDGSWCQLPDGHASHWTDA